MRKFPAAGAFIAFLTAAFAQPAPSGPQAATFRSSVDDSSQRYALYVPPNLDRARKYPLVIGLHGEEMSPEICLMRIFGQTNRFGDGSMAPLRFFRARDVDVIVVCPLARGTMGYEGIAEQDVYDVLADVERRLPVDEDRVYLTGMSMGGGGALRLALLRPDLWAAVALVSPAPPAGLEKFTANALNLPIKLFQGELDPVAPAASSRLWQRRFLDLGIAAEYIEYPTGRHNAWDYAYRDGAVFDWFTQFRRNRFPERVQFVSSSYRYASAYWVRMDELTPGTTSSMDARQSGKMEAMVTTANLGGFTVSVDHPLATVSIDGTSHPIAPPESTVSFHKESGTWVRGIASPGGKRPGLEGPAAAAVSSRHMYVYGTADKPTPEELNQRRAQAERAAAWSTARERLQLKFPVKPDSEVTPQDLDQDLVLLGTRDSNSLIARFADHFPIELSPGAADYGLLFIAPAGKHYVLVNSGLPWWTGADEAGRPTDPFQPQPYAELATFGDYILFKGSLAHVVAEGRFDNAWKVPAADAAKMARTGAVTLH